MAILGVLLLFWFGQAVGMPDCQWSPASQIGVVSAPITEDSGLAVSRRYPDRLYHVNDSGDSGRFFISKAGSSVQTVRVTGFNPVDVEDLAIGACSASSDCLFIADIGDNSRRRAAVEIVVVEERQQFAARVPVKYRVKARYPDGRYDSESLAFHPDGTLYVLTKGGKPRLYRLKKSQWMDSQGKLQTMEYVTTIDFEELGGLAAFIDGRFPTAMDISPDGNRVLVLTYRNVFELLVNFSQLIVPPSQWKEGQQFKLIAVETLPQQEAIAYSADGRAFIYDSERRGSAPAKLMRAECR